MKYLKRFNESVWTDAFDPSPIKEFKPDHRFYKLIEDEIIDFLKSDEIINKQIHPEEFGNDIIGNIIYTFKYNERGINKEDEYGEFSVGHDLYSKLWQKIEKLIEVDPEVIKYTTIKPEGPERIAMSEKIMRDLWDRLTNTMAKLFCKIIKNELNKNSELYDEYKEDLHKKWKDCLPNWVNRAKDTNLLDIKT